MTVQIGLPGVTEEKLQEIDFLQTDLKTRQTSCYSYRRKQRRRRYRRRNGRTIT